MKLFILLLIGGAAEIRGGGGAVDLTPIRTLAGVVDRKFAELLVAASVAGQFDDVGREFEAWAARGASEKSDEEERGDDEPLIASILKATHDVSQFLRAELAEPDDGEWERDIGDAIAASLPWPLELVRRAAAGDAAAPLTTSGEHVISRLAVCRDVAASGYSLSAVMAATEAAEATKKVRVAESECGLGHLAC